MALKPAPMAPEGRRDPKLTKISSQMVFPNSSYAKNQLPPFSQQNSTKIGVGLAKNRKFAKKADFRSKNRQLLA